MTDSIRRSSVGHPYFFRSYTRPMWLAVLVAFSMPGTSDAAVSPVERLEMIRACETVIIDQSFSALSGYDAAPFSSGAPGEKSYAVFNRPRNIVTIAKVAHDRWVECKVRESEKDNLPILERYTEWRKEFVAAFPKPEHRWVRRTLDHSSTNPYALRCSGGDVVLLISAEFSQKHEFTVTVTSELSRHANNPCALGGS